MTQRTHDKSPSTMSSAFTCSLWSVQVIFSTREWSSDIIPEFSQARTSVIIAQVWTAVTLSFEEPTDRDRPAPYSNSLVNFLLANATHQGVTLFCSCSAPAAKMPTPLSFHRKVSRPRKAPLHHIRRPHAFLQHAYLCHIWFCLNSPAGHHVMQLD